ncbi:hypothetical protein MP228_000023 [Amoeboaphelidium protococcarum]|nr:hypothetical protein MP228_000023 [Amoeboaphelidium protococcarum]
MKSLGSIVIQLLLICVVINCQRVDGPQGNTTDLTGNQAESTISLDDCNKSNYWACVSCIAGPRKYFPKECAPLKKQCEDYSKSLRSRPPAYQCLKPNSQLNTPRPLPVNRPRPSPSTGMPMPVNGTKPLNPSRLKPTPSPTPVNGPSSESPSSSPQPPQSNNYDVKLFADCEYEVYQACMECHTGNVAMVQAECGPLREQCSRASAYLQPVPPPFVCPRPVERSPRPSYPPAPLPDSEAGRSKSRRFYVACLKNTVNACQNCLAGPLSMSALPECHIFAPQCEAATRGLEPVPPPYACPNFPPPPPPPPRPPLTPPSPGEPDFLSPPPPTTR